MEESNQYLDTRLQQLQDQITKLASSKAIQPKPQTFTIEKESLAMPKQVRSANKPATAVRQVIESAT